jgi:hypothetical protein
MSADRRACPTCGHRAGWAVPLFSWKTLPVRCASCAALLYAEPNRTLLLLCSSVATALLFAAVWAAARFGFAAALAVVIGLVALWHVPYVRGEVRVLSAAQVRRSRIAAAALVVVFVVAIVLVGLAWGT